MLNPIELKALKGSRCGISENELYAMYIVYNARFGSVTDNPVDLDMWNKIIIVKAGNLSTTVMIIENQELRTNILKIVQ